MSSISGRICTFTSLGWSFSIHLSYLPQTDVYSEPSQTSKSLVKTFNGFGPLTIFAKLSALDV